MAGQKTADYLREGLGYWDVNNVFRYPGDKMNWLHRPGSSQ
jgi:hypothetical protein